MVEPRAEILVPALLLSIARERRTGVLEIRAEGTTTLIYFDAGQVVFAEAGTLSETLGRVLIREGKLTQEQFAAVIERMTCALVDNEQLRFGETAIELGFLTGMDVHEALKLQVRRKLLRCFQWERVECRFDEHPEALQGITRYPSPLDALVVEGIRQYWDRARTDVVLTPLLDRWVRLAVPPEGLAKRFGLSIPETRFVRELKGDRTVREVFSLGSLDDVQARPLFAALVLTEAVELFEERASGEGARDKPSLPPPARVGVHTVRRRAVQVARHLRRALEQGPREVVAPPPKDTIPPEQRARLEGERAYQKGRQQMKYGAWSGAAKDLREAARLCPEMAEYVLYAAWAEHHEGTPDAPDAPELERLSKAALKQDRDLAFAWYVRGRLTMDASEDERALKCFRQAVRLDPDDPEAQRWHRLLSSRQKK